MLHNDATAAFSNWAFYVENFANYRNSQNAINQLKSYDLKTKEVRTISDNNGAFLKAALRNLLPDGEEE